MFPIRTDTAAGSRPWMNWLLILANLLIYGWQRHDPTLLAHYQFNVHTLTVWHFLTYAFLHVGWAHLLLNLFVLYLLGGGVNARFGGAGYLAFYLAGAAFAAIGFLLSGGEAMVGASGAVGAVMGAYLALFPRSRITVSVIGSFETPAIYVLVFYFLYNVVMGITAAGSMQPVAYEAHIAGMLFGFAVAMGLLLADLVQRQPFDMLALLQRWNRRRQYRQLVAGGYDPFALPSPPVRAKPQVDPAAQRITALRMQIGQVIADRDLAMAALLYRELKAIDSEQVLPRPQQLDIANQLAAEQRFGDAADAYERLLAHYRLSDQAEDVQLMLGLMCSRYLNRYARARECLRLALQRLHNPGDIDLARSELAIVEARLSDSYPAQPPTGRS